MNRIEIKFTDEEKAFIMEYIKIKEQTKSGLLRYALKRYLVTNEADGLEMPESLKLCKPKDKV